MFAHATTATNLIWRKNHTAVVIIAISFVVALFLIMSIKNVISIEEHSHGIKTRIIMALVGRSNVYLYMTLIKSSIRNVNWLLFACHEWSRMAVSGMWWATTAGITRKKQENILTRNEPWKRTEEDLANSVAERRLFHCTWSRKGVQNCSESDVCS